MSVSVAQGGTTTEDWLQHYNRDCPTHALDGQSSVTFALAAIGEISLFTARKNWMTTLEFAYMKLKVKLS